MPTATLVRMLVNVGIDTLVGVIPALGDLFDAAWKANTRNTLLLQSHLVSERADRTRSKRDRCGVPGAGGVVADRYRRHRGAIYRRPIAVGARDLIGLSHGAVAKW